MVRKPMVLFYTVLLYTRGDGRSSGLPDMVVSVDLALVAAGRLDSGTKARVPWHPAFMTAGIVNDRHEGNPHHIFNLIMKPRR